MSTKSRLNPAQQKAVDQTEGIVLVNAGAGTGKTHTVIERNISILKKGLARPEQLLCITFTNKAAREMRERMDRSGIPGAERAWVCTFHAFGVRVLRECAPLLGYSPKFAIADADEQAGIIRDLLKDKRFKGIAKPGELVSLIDSWKRNGLTPDDISDKVESADEIALFREYQRILKDTDRMDFNDLITNALEVLENYPDVRAKWQHRFKYITIDEYQDTDLRQHKLAKLLKDGWGNLCVVGDDCQSIYGFRGARPENIITLPEQLDDVKVVALEQNYRSSGSVLDCANTLIANNKKKLDKKLFTEKDRGLPVTSLRFQDEHDEARNIADRIESMRRKGLPYEDMAVLYRIRRVGKVLADELFTRGIRYTLYDGGGLLDTYAVKDFRACLEALDNPRNTAALERFLRNMVKGFGPKLFGALTAEAERRGIPAADVLRGGPFPGLDKRSANTMARASMVFNIFTSEARKGDVAGLIRTIDSTLSYSAQILPAKYKEGREKQIENLERFTKIAGAYSTLTESSLGEFLEVLALNDNTDKEPAGVNLMTVHKSKGLEFDTVFVVGMDDGIFPSAMAVKDAVPGPNSDEMEEERRLAYVAVTRAKRKLYLSSAVYRKGFQKDRYNPALEHSPFIDELPAGRVETVFA